MRQPDVYIKLRDRLNTLGFGYAPTESGVEFTFLQRFFSEEDAEYFLAMADAYQTSAEVAAALSKDPEEVTTHLKDMSKRGLLFRAKKNEEVKFRIIPVAHGIYEFNVNNIEPEWTKDFAKHYMQGLGAQFYSTDTPLLRSIPIKSEIVAGARILPFDDAESIIKSRQEIALAPCMCRAREAARGKACGHPLETCLIFDDFARYYIENGMGRPISSEEALAVIAEGDKDGRVIQVSNSLDVEVMCSCCVCGCGLMGAMKFFPGPAKNVVSNYYCQRDENRCKKKCYKICSGRCPIGAIVVEEGVSRIDRHKCIGCGLCVTACSNHAISLRKKTEDRVYQPPETLFDAYGNMQAYRNL
jgi:NAD-dependent dihydropyrimidine dehydrogenase PreA subunit